MLTQPVHRLLIGEQVLSFLREAILSGEIKQGEMLGEPGLATRFGVSRAPVREALLILEAEGLLRFNRRGRAQVVSLSADLFEELATVRAALEPLAAQLAVGRGAAGLLETLRSNLDQQRTAPTYRELTRLDVAFHEAILRATANERLLSAWLTVRSLMEFWLVTAYGDVAIDSSPRELAVNAHAELIEALASGNEQRAADAMRQHIERWRTIFPDTGSAVASARDPSGIIVGER